MSPQFHAKKDKKIVLRSRDVIENYVGHNITNTPILDDLEKFISINVKKTVASEKRKNI